MPKAMVEIIYQDDDILVVNKPAGVSVTKDRTGASQLVDFLTDQLSRQIYSQLRLVHRLDKDTSGVMILAKNAETQSVFSSYFEKKLVKKTLFGYHNRRCARTAGHNQCAFGTQSQESSSYVHRSKKGKGRGYRLAVAC